MIEFKPLNKVTYSSSINGFKSQLSISYTRVVKHGRSKILKINTFQGLQAMTIYRAANKPIGFIQYYCLSEHYPEGIKNKSSLFKNYQPS